MRSRLLRGADLEELPLPDLTVELESDALEGELRTHLTNERLARRYYEAADIVEAQTLVELKESDENSDGLRIAVGLGLFDEAQEEKLLGKRVGDRVCLLGRNYVIAEAKNYRVPEEDDAFAGSLAIAGVSTLEEYKDYLRRYYRDFYRDGYALYFAAELFETWVQASEFLVDEKEMEEAFSHYRALQGRYREAHDSYLDGTEEEIEAFEREEFETFFYQALAAEVPELKMDTQSDLEAVMQKALKPFRDYLIDRVRFVGTEAE